MDGENKAKDIDEIYCSECGKLIKKTADYCEHCGTKIKEGKRYHPKIAETVITNVVPATPKSKAVAITLAAIFSYWSWLYTFKKDKKKFWIFFGIIMFFGIIYIMYSCSNLAASMVDPYYDVSAMANTYRGFLIIISIVNFVSWCWALSDSIRSPLSFYLNYPNEERFERQINNPIGKIKI